MIALYSGPTTIAPTITMRTLADCHLQGMVAASRDRPDLAGKKILSTVTVRRLYVRIAAVTAATSGAGRRCRCSRDREAGRLGTPAARQLTAVGRGKEVEAEHREQGPHRQDTAAVCARAR